MTTAISVFTIIFTPAFVLGIVYLNERQLQARYLKRKTPKRARSKNTSNFFESLFIPDSSDGYTDSSHHHTDCSHSVDCSVSHH